MLYEFQVVTMAYVDFFLGDYDNRLHWVKERGYVPTLRCQSMDGDRRLLVLRLEGEEREGVFRDEDVVYVFKHQIAEFLTEHIVKDWRGLLLRREVTRACRRLTPQERDDVQRRAMIFLKKCHDNEGLDMLLSFNRKNRIASRLFDYMRDNMIINIEGFINFCMRDYLTELKFAVEVALEELRNQKEYRDFVNFLRYFVDTQRPKVYEVNLMMKGNRRFCLWDGQGCKIEEKYIRYCLDEMLLDEVSLDDVLISILITIAPRKIVLHNVTQAESEPVALLKSVFKEKISECRGCERCCQYKLGNDCEGRRQY